MTIKELIEQLEISIHTFLAEGDFYHAAGSPLSVDFNPHLPRRRRLDSSRGGVRVDVFQSTPSSQKATAYRGRRAALQVISIHTFLAEGDIGGSDASACLGLFQSTPSSQKATGSGLCAIWNQSNFNPHLPRRRRLKKARELNNYTLISIHTFLAEGDLRSCYCYYGFFRFQSTPSSQKATTGRKGICTYCQISIHTFLAEGDTFRLWIRTISADFNPHLPRRRRP